MPPNRAVTEPYPPRPSKDPPPPLDDIFDAYPSPASDSTASDMGSGRAKVKRSCDACLNCRARKKRRSRKKGSNDEPCSELQVVFDIHDRRACRYCFHLGIGCFASFGEQRPKWQRDKQNMYLLRRCMTEFINNHGDRRGVAGKPHKPSTQDKTQPRPYLSVQDMVLYVLTRNPPSPGDDQWWIEYIPSYNLLGQQLTTAPDNRDLDMLHSPLLSPSSAFSPQSTLLSPTPLDTALVALNDFTSILSDCDATTTCDLSLQFPMTNGMWDTLLDFPLDPNTPSVTSTPAFPFPDLASLALPSSSTNLEDTDSFIGMFMTDLAEMFSPQWCMNDDLLDAIQSDPSAIF